MDKNTLLSHIGTFPAEGGLKKRLRFHQGWWRTFVINQAQGKNPANANENVCNTITDGNIRTSNFLTDAAIKSVTDTKAERKGFSAGLFNEDRLYNNLLSSQPLAFNFFGSLKQDTDFAKAVIGSFIPKITRVTNVFFEFAPAEKYSNDNSAFDVAIEMEIGDKKGLFGIECKYTDSFSNKAYRKDAYQEIYNASKSFIGEYNLVTSSRFNQLFRNQLIAEALIQNKKYDFVYTGLFCYHGDVDAVETGREFRNLLVNGTEKFKIITYNDFITSIQKLELSWKQREESMMLWARYCGLGLSQHIYDCLLSK